MDAPETETQRARAARQFSLNVQFPSGFEENSNPGFSTNTNPPQFAQSAPSQFNRQSPSQFAQHAQQDVSQFAQPAVPFQNFPSFSQLTTQPPAGTFRQTRYMTIYEYVFCIPHICHFLYTGRIFENQILHPKKRLKAPKTLKMSLKKSNICIFFTQSGKIYT